MRNIENWVDKVYKAMESINSIFLFVFLIFVNRRVIRLSRAVREPIRAMERSRDVDELEVES